MESDIYISCHDEAATAERIADGVADFYLTRVRNELCWHAEGVILEFGAIASSKHPRDMAASLISIGGHLASMLGYGLIVSAVERRRK